jgi:pyruvate/2-oxoglutarate dehydrogenase complex dihydrolipoamide acyltransferase (E2) component
VGIGFAINAGRSLRVPVVRCESRISLPETAAAIRNLFLRYMREELTLPDLTGGTFTVTDLSSHGVVHFVPVLNLNQSAILGLCAERPGSGTRDLVLTFDHRMSDGMRAAEFLGELRARLEAATAS